VAKSVVIDEIHVTVRVPADLPDKPAAAVRRTLSGAAFTRALREAVLRTVRRFPELSACRTTVTR
jgi:hypothetical protein